jgi:hypothetical protein
VVLNPSHRTLKPAWPSGEPQYRAAVQLTQTAVVLNESATKRRLARLRSSDFVLGNGLALAALILDIPGDDRANCMPGQHEANLDAL